MQHYYDHVTTITQGPLEIIVDKTWEDLPIRDCFDDSCYDIREMEQQVDQGYLDWFMLRVRVQLEGVELAAEYLGGLMYEDARDVLKDGVAADMIAEALHHAKQRAAELRVTFQNLADEVFTLPAKNA